MKPLILASIVLLSSSCISRRESNQVESQHLTSFQEEVLQWYSAAESMSETGDAPPARSEREAAWRELHVAWGEETFRSLEQGERRPEAIHHEVVSRTARHEQRFIDECVRHGYDLAEVLALVDFEKGNLESTIYSAVEEFVRSQPK